MEFDQEMVPKQFNQNLHQKKGKRNMWIEKWRVMESEIYTFTVRSPYAISR